MHAVSKNSDAFWKAKFSDGVESCGFSVVKLINVVVGVLKFVYIQCLQYLAHLLDLFINLIY